MKSLLEQIDERLAATKDCGDSGCINRDKTKPAGMRTNGGCRCRRASRNQREGELAALKCAVEALEKPYICSVCGDRSKEKCGRVCDGDESSCCKYFLNFDQALAQITKLMGEGK